MKSVNENYFSHDYNSRQDIKIKRLVTKHGMLGYGTYWAIVEMLYINENEIDEDYEILHYDLRVEEDVIRSIINDFDLFYVRDGKIGSKAIDERLEIRKLKTEKAKYAVGKRWEKHDKRVRRLPTNTLFYIIKIYDEEEEFLKVGNTTLSISRRFSGNTGPYNYELIYSRDEEYSLCLSVEEKIANKFLQYVPQKKFGSSKECYNILDLKDITDFAIHQFNLCITSNIKEKNSKEKNSKDSIAKEDQPKNVASKNNGAGKDEYLDVIKYLNEQSGKRLGLSEDVYKRMKTIHNAGYSFDDMKRACYLQVLSCKGTEDEKYMHPKTIFRNEDNFTRCLNLNEELLLKKRKKIGGATTDLKKILYGEENVNEK